MYSTLALTESDVLHYHVYTIMYTNKYLPLLHVHCVSFQGTYSSSLDSFLVKLTYTYTLLYTRDGQQVLKQHDQTMAELHSYIHEHCRGCTL